MGNYHKTHRINIHCQIQEVSKNGNTVSEQNAGKSDESTGAVDDAKEDKPQTSNKESNLDSESSFE